MGSFRIKSFAGLCEVKWDSYPQYESRGLVLYWSGEIVLYRKPSGRNVLRRNEKYCRGGGRLPQAEYRAEPYILYLNFSGDQEYNKFNIIRGMEVMLWVMLKYEKFFEDITKTAAGRPERVLKIIPAICTLIFPEGHDIPWGAQCGEHRMRKWFFKHAPGSDWQLPVRSMERIVTGQEDERRYSYVPVQSKRRNRMYFINGTMESISW